MTAEIKKVGEGLRHYFNLRPLNDFDFMRLEQITAPLVKVEKEYVHVYHKPETTVQTVFKVVPVLEPGDDLFTPDEIVPVDSIDGVDNTLFKKVYEKLCEYYQIDFKDKSRFQNVCRARVHLCRYILKKYPGCCKISLSRFLGMNHTMITHYLYYSKADCIIPKFERPRKYKYKRNGL